jgi:hypothetical protein
MADHNKGDDEREYEVGYGKPPKDKRFKKGQSGNPKGRPKRARGIATELGEELIERVIVRENGTVKKISKMRAIVKAQVTKAMSGDTRAAQAVIAMIATHIIDHAETNLGIPPQAEDEKLIDDILAKFSLGSDGGNENEH